MNDGFEEKGPYLAELEFSVSEGTPVSLKETLVWSADIPIAISFMVIDSHTRQTMTQILLHHQNNLIFGASGNSSRRVLSALERL